VIHRATAEFWTKYHELPYAVRATADAAFVLLKKTPRHPSLHFKAVGKYKSVRIGIHHRAVGVDIPGGVLWIWIGTHAEYDRIVG